MTTAKSSYMIAMALDDLAYAIGETDAYSVLKCLEGVEISSEDAGEVKREIDQMRDVMGMDRG